MNRKLGDEQKFNDVLAECVELIRERKATIEECLERYPDLKDKLEPLLGTALLLQETPQVEPRPEFKMAARLRLMQELGSPLPAVERKVRPRRILLRLAAASLALLLIFSGIATASTKRLPDSPLYPIKRAIERVQLVTKSTDKSRALAHLSFSEERLEEAEAMVRAKETRLAQKMLEEMNQETEKASWYAQRVSGKDKEMLLAKLVSLLERQQAVFERLFEQAPLEARTALEHAKEVSRQGLEQAKEALEETKPKVEPEKQSPKSPSEEYREERKEERKEEPPPSTPGDAPAPEDGGSPAQEGGETPTNGGEGTPGPEGEKTLDHEGGGSSSTPEGGKSPGDSPNFFKSWP